jgi:hypothetical protein
MTVVAPRMEERTEKDPGRETIILSVMFSNFNF